MDYGCMSLVGQGIAGCMQREGVSEPEGIWRTLRWRIEVPIERYFTSVDLTVVLGNLLENAVQVAGSVAAGRRYVDIRAREVENVCIIMVRNSYDGKLNARNGGFLSTKHEGAGIGLESVKMIAKRLYGECSVDYTEHDFTVRVSMPMMSTGRDADKA